MFSTANLDKRKQKILEAIVRNHLHTAQPVASSTIFENYFHEFSPATIRAEMAHLEEAGYIMQPHTSAGRIPTDLGYRFYVDYLMKRRELTSREEAYLERELEHAFEEKDDIYHQVARVLSNALDYTSVVVNLGSHHKTFFAGISSIFHQPEFQKIEQAQHILNLLEEEEVLTKMMEEYVHEDDDISIKIGHENKYIQVKECSVIATSYDFEGEQGAVGIIGPTRMFYGKTLCIIKYVSKCLKNVGRKKHG